MNQAEEEEQEEGGKESGSATPSRPSSPHVATATWAGRLLLSRCPGGAHSSRGNGPARASGRAGRAPPPRLAPGTGGDSAAGGAEASAPQEGMRPSLDQSAGSPAPRGAPVAD